jgi:hypothetical protein
VLALSDILRESPALDHEKHETGAISALMECIEERARLMPDLHGGEGEAVLTAETVPNAA